MFVQFNLSLFVFVYFFFYSVLFFYHNYPEDATTPIVSYVFSRNRYAKSGKYKLPS